MQSKDPLVPLQYELRIPAAGAGMISAGMGIRFRRLIRVGAWHLHSIEDDGSFHILNMTCTHCRCHKICIGLK